MWLPWRFQPNSVTYPPDHWLTRPVAYFMAEFSRERREERARAIKPLTVRFSILPTVDQDPGRVKVRRMTLEERLAYRDQSKPVWSRLTAAQGNRCYLCNRTMASPTEDHVLPKALGGKNSLNRLMACSPCNNQKAARRPYVCEMLFLDHINRVVFKRQRPIERPTGEPTKEAAKKAAFSLAMEQARRERLGLPSALIPETEPLQAAE